jgi:hypothetical protein
MSGTVDVDPISSAPLEWLQRFDASGRDAQSNPARASRVRDARRIEA